MIRGPIFHAKPFATSAVANLSVVPGTDGAVQFPAKLFRHPQRHLRWPDAGHPGIGRGVGDVSHRVFLYRPGDRPGGGRLGVDRPGMGRPGDRNGQGDYRCHPDPGRLGGPSGRRAGQPVCAPGIAGVGHAGGCARRCGGLRPDDDVDHAVAAGVHPLYPTAAWGQRHDFAVAGIDGLHPGGLAADACADSRLDRPAAHGHPECGVCRAGG